MTTEENILENMLDRATNPDAESMDELAMRMFCMEVRHDTKLIDRALELIMNKIRSNNETEAIRAIVLLEESMAKCGTDFQNEVAKFRFLNDLIRLVSNKYKGAQTPLTIKKRLIQCLLLWTTDFPQKTKIRDAYDLLSKELGSLEQGNCAVIAKTKRESTLGIDEQLLTKLLRSGDADNLKRANLLIQHRVNQEARHAELIRQHKSELTTVQTTVALLNQVLDTYESESTNGVNDDTRNLIRDLYLECKKHKPILKRLPELIENLDNELVVSTLETNESLHEVIKRYKEIVHKPPNTALINNSNTSSNTDLLASLLDDLQPPATTATKTTGDSSKVHLSAIPPDPFDELSKHFGQDRFSESINKADELLCNVDLLSDVALLPITTTTTTTEAAAAAKTINTTLQNVVTEKRPFRDLPEIDEISTALLKTGLQNTERVGFFKKDVPEKQTLNDLAKERSNPTAIAAPLTSLGAKQIPRTGTIESIENVSINNKSITNQELAEQDEVMLLSNVDETILSAISPTDCVKDAPNFTTAFQKSKLCEKSMQSNNEQPLKHLSDIDVCLDSVVPTGEALVLLDDEDIKITLNFTENRPVKHVSVVVISVLNKSKSAIKDFQFEASVKKPSKVRLLPSTDVSILPWRPFRPPMPINQVMLLLNSTGKAVDVTCIVSYKLGHDPDAITETIVAKDIPYVV